MREGPSRLQARNIGNCCMRSDIKKDLIGSEDTRSSVVQLHLKGLGRYKTPTAHDQFGAALLIDPQVLHNLALHHLALAPTNRRHVDSDGTSDCAVAPAVTC